jgi:hypothetical protein
VFVVTHGRLKTFLDLPNLLAEARVFCSDVIYLWDYWEGTIAGDDPPYWNKGDYRPRADLGGEPAFIEGIQRVHGNGGRVLLYLEPFIIYEQSDIGRCVGADWQALDANGKPLRIYPGNFKMVAPLNDWQDYVVSVAERLVGTYGADGIFLDSYGWKMNQQVKAQAENRLYSPLEHSQGVLRLTDRVRQAVQAIKADAVVLGETAAGPIGRRWDGGFAADFGFAALTSGPPRLPASPVRYAVPEIAWYSNGLKLSELHQVFAAGHGLALCSAWPGSWMYDNAHHIRKLVEIRQQHADALVYGQQSYQPHTGTDNVVAYRYHGTHSDLLTIVNMDDGSATSVNLILQSNDRDTRWLDLLDSSTMKASGETLQGVSLAAGGIRVLKLQTD